jgi:hypothetical protein
MGPGDFYSMFKLEGRDAAATYTMRKEQRAQGIPPHWMIYITVESADHAVARAAQAGGTVLSPAFDVMDVGRMAVLQDPTGAIFSIWQAGTHAGATIGNTDNTFCWADLSTPDPQRAAKFYSDVFGWQVIKDDKDPSGYLHIRNGESFIGGIPPVAHRRPDAPAHWLLYFQVADPESATNKAAKLNGKILMPARKMENVGTWSIVADPQGAVFALFKSAR